LRFQILSHAGLQVRAQGKELLCDPWLLGSAFWRSWWNLPEVSPDLIANLKPDVIYLTHIHWDHFHGPSLKLFPRETRIVIPYDRYERMRRDLEDIGFHDITELKHGERFEIAPGFTIRSFHIAPVVLDSAVVVEADGVVLLNAADAKLAGAPLSQITREYPRIDFALRSHSSANARSCYHVIGREDELLDDTQHYLRAFSLFMKRVRPRYAIPFASNHCHLHRETLAYNDLVQSPARVVDYFGAFRTAHDLETEIQVLVSGEGWDSGTGFFTSDSPLLSDREGYLADLARRMQPTLEAYYRKEAALQSKPALMSRWALEMKGCIPALLRRRLDREVLVVSRAGDRRWGYAINPARGTSRTVDAAGFAAFTVRVEMPEIVLRQAVMMNMFHHAEVSKRLHLFATQADMPLLRLFVTVLTLKEAEILPLRGMLTLRTLKAVLPRWRELLLYVEVVLLGLQGLKVSQIEERLLSAPERSRRARRPRATPALETGGG
jgi:UDP-MurNAc hydroxylase